MSLATGFLGSVASSSVLASSLPAGLLDESPTCMSKLVVVNYCSLG
jgi:hypothetical protein